MSFVTVFFPDLASHLRTVKDPEDLAVEIRKYLEKNLPDVFRQVIINQRDASFRLPLSLISEQLSNFRDVYKKLQASA